ncbi:13859_t:CDS:2 [Entrophospora sp. SA101]|nr:13859_t:CDS:2 [Entrophospora sp. SA101]
MNERFKEFDDDKYLTCFFLDPHFRNTPLKKGAYAKVVKCAMTIGKRLGFDLHESKILCEQLQRYKDHEEPFDLDIVCCSEDPRSWWNLIDTDSQPDTLPTLARHLFSICPNSAKSMSKMIMYWKSNAKTELGFYGLNNKKKTHLSDTEINISISEAFAETDDNDNESKGEDETSFFINNETIPEYNCIVLIENVWIEKFVDLLHDLIIKEIGNIPEDVLDDYDNSDIDEYENVNMTNEGEKGILDYNIDDLLGEFLNEEV